MPIMSNVPSEAGTKPEQGGIAIWRGLATLRGEFSHEHYT
jgi:hypothetical protein